MKTILVTGCAGFIGSHVTKALLDRGDKVIGIDDFNDYYDVQLKEDRITKLIGENENFKLYRGDFSDNEFLEKVFSENKFDLICHLGAQAGVRYSIENPFAYEKANNVGTLNIFEQAKKHEIKKVVFASSSSVYGGNTKTPFSSTDRVDTPISLYAATKRYNELLAHVYHHLHGIQMIGLRFFTVYGPWGRPDMALFLFTKAISEGKPIKVFNHGDMERDFTYITDIVDGVLAAIDKDFNYEIFNLGNSSVVKLNYFIECIEKELGKKATKNLMPMQPGDVKKTYADITREKEVLGFNPTTKIEEGIKEFVKWYKRYYPNQS